jgi:hypothetical protein
MRRPRIISGRLRRSGQATWLLGVSVREYRELVAGARSPSFETWDPDL